MEQDRKHRNKPMHIWSISLTKGAWLHKGGKTVSSTNGAGKTGQLYVKKKKEKLGHSLTLRHKSKLKMD